MDPNLTTAIVSASATALVAIVALLQNSKRLDRVERQLDILAADQNSRMADLRSHLDSRIDDLRRLMDANTKGIMDKLDSIDQRVTDLESHAS